MKKIYQLLFLLIAMVAINSSCTEKEYYKVEHGYITYTTLNPWNERVRNHVEFTLQDDGKAELYYDGGLYRNVPYQISGNKIIFKSSIYMNPRYMGAMYDTNFLTIKITSFNSETGIGTVNLYRSYTNNPGEADKWVLLVGNCKLDAQY